MEPLKIVSISFHSAGKLFDFEVKDLDLVPGDKVIVETERGRALGTVINKPREIKPEEAPPKLKSILRIANENDLNMSDNNGEREQEALKFCMQKVQQRKLDMKLVRAEYLFDGSKIIFYFTADGRIDFRELVRDLAQHFRTRIEMRQIGVRDEAKLVGGLGICGRELCCATHLREFAPVSVKMAKAQGLALNPSKISGQCGRLLCCLAYEYETYNELKKGLPKCGKKVQLKEGKAEVVGLDILAQKVTLCCHDGERCTMHAEELKQAIQSGDSRNEPEKGQENKGKAAPKSKEGNPEHKPKRTNNRNNRRPPKGHSGDQSSDKKPAEAAAKNQHQETTDKQAEKNNNNKPQQRRRKRPRRRPSRPKGPESNS